MTVGIIPESDRKREGSLSVLAHFCLKGSLVVFSPTAASFLFTLFDTHSLSPQTVKGYRTCLGSVPNWQGQSGSAQNHLRHDRFNGVTEA